MHLMYANFRMVYVYIHLINAISMLYIGVIISVAICVFHKTKQQHPQKNLRFNTGNWEDLKAMNVLDKKVEEVRYPHGDNELL